MLLFLKWLMSKKKPDDPLATYYRSASRFVWNSILVTRPSFELTDEGVTLLKPVFDVLGLPADPTSFPHASDAAVREFLPHVLPFHREEHAMLPAFAEQLQTQLLNPPLVLHECAFYQNILSRGDSVEVIQTWLDQHGYALQDFHVLLAAWLLRRGITLGILVLDHLDRAEYSFVSSSDRTAPTPT